MEVCLRQLVDEHVALLQPNLGQHHETVVAVLPDGVVAVGGHELELEAPRQPVGVEVHGPLVGVHLVHGQRLLGIPSAQVEGCSHDGQPLVAAELRHTHLQPDDARLPAHGLCLGLAPADALGEGRGVEVAVLGYVYPVVVHHLSRRFGGGELQPVGHHLPLAAHHRVVAAHAIVVVAGGFIGSTELHFACPVLTVGGRHVVLCSHLSAGRCDVQHQLFAEGGPILQVENELHNQL